MKYLIYFLVATKDKKFESVWNEEFLITWENTLINGEGHWETKLRIRHAVTFNGEMQSRKKSFQKCLFLFVWGSHGWFLITFLFFSVFSKFSTLNTYFITRKTIKTLWRNVITWHCSSGYVHRAFSWPLA